MPVLESSSFSPPFFLRNGHVQTLVPVMFRKKVPLLQKRLRIDTPDNDFLDMDLTIATQAVSQPDTEADGYADIHDSRHISIPPRPAPPTPDAHFKPGTANPRLLIISHGLEGNSRRNYVRGAARVATSLGMDALAWNFRCCSGECNRMPQMYHSGETKDLACVVAKAVEWGYTRIVLAGYSMGGNQILHFLGHKPKDVPPEVMAAIAFSVPCDMLGAARKLDSLMGKPYTAYFLRTLKEKIAIKHRQYPALYPIHGLKRIRTFAEFDEKYTAPVFGFDSARDYWEKSSSAQYLTNIAVPTLVVNARNDPFLSESCYPFAQAEQSAALYLETPASGGHVGFAQTVSCCTTWAEKRLEEFLAQCLENNALPAKPVPQESVGNDSCA